MELMFKFGDTAVQHNYIGFSFFVAKCYVSFKKIFSLSSHMGKAISFRFDSQKFGFHDSNTVGYG